MNVVLKIWYFTRLKEMLFSLNFRFKVTKLQYSPIKYRLEFTGFHVSKPDRALLSSHLTDLAKK